MTRKVFAFISFLVISVSLCAQTPASKEQQDLEKERQQLKREIEQAQQMLESNRKTTKVSLNEYNAINHKLTLQQNLLNNINRELNILDNNIVKSQRSVHKLQLLLDTLKMEYAKSMVYSYKNRNNSDFMNFVFSANSFNDAIKRITYLRSYRTYREMQGENILRTEELLKGRIHELTGNKEKKTAVLDTQSKEAEVLKTQQQEKDQVVKKLKAQAKELNNQVAAKKKQMMKVNNAIAAAIKRAQEEARKAAAKAEAERQAEAKRLAKSNTTPEKGENKTTVKPVKERHQPVAQTSVLLGTEKDVTLNNKFEGNRGILPWPVEKGYIMTHFGTQKLEIGVTVDNPGITIGSEIGTTVKAIFEGEVSSVTNLDDMQIVIIKHGRYFTTYSNLTGVNLARGAQVRTGQVIGKVTANLDGVGAIDIIISNEHGNLNPEQWLRHH